MIRVEFVPDVLNNTTLILVWKGQQIIHKETIEGTIEDKEKLIKKFKRKFKEKNVK